MSGPYTAPTFEGLAFNCPACAAFAKQRWHDIHYSDRGGLKSVKDWRVALCDHCSKPSFWSSGVLRYPDIATAPLPNADLPQDIADDYQEARNIAARSPRGAAGLLRLCIQKLCKFLGEKGDNLNDDIRNLVAKGLPNGVQKSLDVVRVIGNEAVHPGTIDLRDDSVSVEMLFRLVNLISEKMITEPKQVDEIYGLLPAEKKAQIEKRDARRN